MNSSSEPPYPVGFVCLIMCYVKANFWTKIKEKGTARVRGGGSGGEGGGARCWLNRDAVEVNLT